MVPQATGTLGTTIKNLRRTTSGAAGYGLSTSIKCLLVSTGAGLGTTIKYLRRTTSAAAENGLGTTIKYLRRTSSGAAGYGLGTTAKSPATHNERNRGHRHAGDF
jgi:hypothetical protein